MAGIKAELRCDVMTHGGLESRLEHRGKASRWVVHGGLSRARFELHPGERSGLSVFLERVKMEEVDFSGLDFALFYAAGATFLRCDFSDASFFQLGFGQPQIQKYFRRAIAVSDPRYPQTVYEECIFRRTKFDPANTHFGNVRFVRCLFDRAWLRDMLFMRSAEFIDCRFLGKIVECNFFGTISDRDTVKRVGRSTNVFRGNDFRGADLVWVGFRGIDLAAQHWPESGEYAILTDPSTKIEAAIQRARATLGGDDLQQVVSALTVLAQRHAGERQALLKLWELTVDAPADLQHKLWDLLVPSPGPP